MRLQFFAAWWGRDAAGVEAMVDAPADPDTGEPLVDFRAQNLWLREHVRGALEPTKVDT